MGQKICFVGAPSSGKTTLVKALERHLSGSSLSVEAVYEYARDFIANHGKPRSVDDQLKIVQGQIEKESKATSDITLCDSASFLSYTYTKFYFPDSDRLPEIKNLVVDHAQSYDAIFYIPRMFSLEYDGIRYQTEWEAAELDHMIFVDMVNLGLSFVTINTDSINNRIKTVVNTMGWRL